MFADQRFSPQIRTREQAAKGTILLYKTITVKIFRIFQHQNSMPQRKLPVFTVLVIFSSILAQKSRAKEQQFYSILPASTTCCCLTSIHMIATYPNTDWIYDILVFFWFVYFKRVRDSHFNRFKSTLALICKL